MPLSIEELKARLAATKIKGQGGNFLRLDPDKPVTVHVLPGNDSLWFRQIGTHWLGKNRINCANPTGEGAPCYICEQIKAQKEELAAARREHEDDTPEEAAENAVVFNAVEEAIGRISPRRNFAFNVLVRGEETPKTIEAPWQIFNAIYTMFNSAVNDYGMDITDPHESTPFTLLRTGSGKNGTRYSAVAAPKGIPLFKGPEAETKIEAVLTKMLDLDKQYKCPEKTELVAAWKAYTNSSGEEGGTVKAETGKASAPPVPRSAPPKSPPSMSRIGVKPATAAGKPSPPKPAPAPEPEAEPESEPEPEEEEAVVSSSHGNGVSNGEENEFEEEPAPEGIPTKAAASLASNKLLTRLRGKK
jgi:hypothetical protein